jgi:hypothetical protein
MIRNIEEMQQSLHDRFDDFLDMGHAHNSLGGPADGGVISARLTGLESQVASVAKNVAILSDSVAQLLGQQSGSQSVMDRVSQLNHIAHNKLSFIEQTSQRAHDKAEELHAAFKEREESRFWWYMCLVALQAFVVLWLALNWRKLSRSSPSAEGSNKKFI